MPVGFASWLKREVGTCGLSELDRASVLQLQEKFLFGGSCCERAIQEEEEKVYIGFRKPRERFGAGGLSGG